MCLPLILIIGCLVIYPALYSIYLSMLNKAQTRFIGLGNFSFLLSRDVFWMVVQQSAIFALTAVFFKALIGLITAHLINNLPAKGQRKWRGMLPGARFPAENATHVRNRITALVGKDEEGEPANQRRDGVTEP